MRRRARTRVIISYANRWRLRFIFYFTFYVSRCSRRAFFADGSTTRNMIMILYINDLVSWFETIRMWLSWVCMSTTQHRIYALEMNRKHPGIRTTTNGSVVLGPCQSVVNWIHVTWRGCYNIQLYRCAVLHDSKNDTYTIESDDPQLCSGSSRAEGGGSIYSIFHSKGGQRGKGFRWP